VSEILDVQVERHGIYTEVWWGKLLKNGEVSLMITLRKIF
jgi:hypothetical protein